MAASGLDSGSDLPQVRRVTIAGVGLLGGSVALALRRSYPRVHITGLVRNRKNAQQLVASGMLDQQSDDLAVACRDCDLIVVATPVDRLAEIVIDAAQCSPQDCLITDVGSTKAAIVKAVAGNRTAARKFVAAHPIAGSENSGAQYASADLFDNKPVVITPDEATPAGQLKRAEALWSVLGGQTVVMSAQEHDVHLAAVSHVPHLVSALVTNLVRDPAGRLVGSGWRDITRVAAGDPEMWAAICQANRQAILSEMDRLAHDLDALRSIIARDDDRALFQWLAMAKQTKDNIS